MSDLGFHEEIREASIAAITFHQKDAEHVGLALTDTEKFQLHLCEFRDDLHFTILETALLQTRPLKCIAKLPNEMKKKQLQNVFNKCGVPYVFASSSDFRDAVEVSDIKRLLRESDQAMFLSKGIDDLRVSRQALGCALKASMRQIDSSSAYNQFTLHQLVLNRYMRLDKAAFSALQILPRAGERMNSPTSLFGLLNRTKTSMGQRRLTVWITQPSIDRSEIVGRHDIVELFVYYSDIRRLLQQDFLRQLPNLDSLTHKLHKVNQTKDVEGLSLSKCDLNDVYQLSEAIQKIHGVLAVLEGLRIRAQSNSAIETLTKGYVEPITMYLKKMDKFMALVEYTIDPEEIARGIALINRKFNAKLSEAAEQKDKIWETIDLHRAAIEDDLGLSLSKGRASSKSASESQSVKIMECGSHGFVFRVTKKDQKAVQKDTNRFRQVRINKAEFQFTTKRLMILVNDYKEACAQFDKLQESLAKKTVAAASTYWTVVEQLSELIGQLDVLVAFAEVSMSAPIPFVRPKVYGMHQQAACLEVHTKEDTTMSNDVTFSASAIVNDVTCDNDLPQCSENIKMESHSQPQEKHATDSIASTASDEVSRIRLKKGRHPLVEHHLQWKISSSKPSDFIPNSIDLSSDSRLVNIVTGPNMGGKSTYIRQVALCCLMSQIGCFVPAESAELSVVDAILCRIGASDDQLKGVSTFLAEMIEASAILKSATSNSLVVIDELGRGTSTHEGFGLAWEITKYLALTTRSFTLFATHFHELGDLAKEIACVFNSQVTAYVNVASKKLSFLFGVVDGCADMSYGIQVAEMAGLKPEVILRAKEKAAELDVVEQQAICTSEERSIVKEHDEAIHNLFSSMECLVDQSTAEFIEFCSQNISMLKSTLVALGG